MHNDPSNLMAAVCKAKGRRLNKKRFYDRFYIQKGCYILNRWGYGPEYSYRLFVKGPYSPELANDIDEMGEVTDITDIPVDVIRNLSLVLKRGIHYTEAYATVMMVIQNNPRRSNEVILRKSLDVSPRLNKEIAEAYQSIMNDLSE